MRLVPWFLLLIASCVLGSMAQPLSAGLHDRTVARTIAASPTSQNTVSPLLTQKISRRATQRFGYGGTVTVVGAPHGSIVVEGWPRNEVEVAAEIELQAATEEDLKRLAAVNGFVFDEDLNHVRILTTGTHDPTFMRRATKNFPKRLLRLPWKIDYRIRVPGASDVEIDAGRGPIRFSGVEGALRG